MKALFAFLFLSSLAFACVCSGNISSSFSSFSSHVREKLNAQSQSLSVLTQSIQKNTQILISQNILLKRELALVKKEILQSEELIFLLKQKNQLE